MSGNDIDSLGDAHSATVAPAAVAPLRGEGQSVESPATSLQSSAPTRPDAWVIDGEHTAATFLAAGRRPRDAQAQVVERALANDKAPLGATTTVREYKFQPATKEEGTALLCEQAPRLLPHTHIEFDPDVGVTVTMSIRDSSASAGRRMEILLEAPLQLPPGFTLSIVSREGDLSRDAGLELTHSNGGRFALCNDLQFLRDHDTTTEALFLSPSLSYRAVAPHAPGEDAWNLHHFYRTHDGVAAAPVRRSKDLQHLIDDVIDRRFVSRQQMQLAARVSLMKTNVAPVQVEGPTSDGDIELSLPFGPWVAGDPSGDEEWRSLGVGQFLLNPASGSGRIECGARSRLLGREEVSDLLDGKSVIMHIFRDGRPVLARLTARASGRRADLRLTLASKTA